MGSSYRFFSIGLGLLFCAAGVVKVVPLEPAHGMQKSEFNRFVRVFPFQSFTGYQPSADLYRTVVGVMELVFGTLLAFGTYEWHCYSSYALLGIMIGAVYTLLALADPVQNVIIPAIFGGLLFYLITRQGMETMGGFGALGGSRLTRAPRHLPRGMGAVSLEVPDLDNQ